MNVDERKFYKCSCGYKTDDKTDFTKHVLLGGRQDGKGSHKSLGIFNDKGVMIMPPWAERTKKEKRLSQGNINRPTRVYPALAGDEVCVRREILKQTAMILEILKEASKWQKVTL